MEPEAGVEGDAAAALVGAPKPNVGLEGWLAGVLVAPKVGVDVEGAPNPKTGFDTCESVFCAVPKGDEEEVDDAVFPNENADFGASSGFAALLEGAPKGDEVAFAAGAPKGDDDAPGAGAPNGDAFVVDVDAGFPPNEKADLAGSAGLSVLLGAAPNGDAFEEAPFVAPNPKADLPASAGFVALFAAAPKGDAVADEPEARPKGDAVVDAPPNALDVEAGALVAPKENGDFAAEEVVVAFEAPKGLVDAGAEDAVGCELLLVTPKLNLGAELAGAEEDAGAEGAVPKTG